MTGRVQPYALLGLGVMFDDDSTPGGSSSSDSAFVGKLGLGFDVWATDWLGMNLEWTYQLPSGTLRDLDYMAVTWSVVYRFSDEEE